MAGRLLSENEANGLQYGYINVEGILLSVGQLKLALGQLGT